jgi:hypothetical protein
MSIDANCRLSSAVTVPRALLAALVIVVSGSDAHGLTLYDNFAGASLDPERWAAYSTRSPGGSPGTSPTITELTRGIEGGAARLRLRASGHAGFASSAVNVLQVAHPAVVDGTAGIGTMEARVRVAEAAVARPDPACHSRAPS